ncbi:Histone-lysine N-methyltransferase set-6 [Elasticomyces elasticus]|nr:Histone-lysine N-methyltransferase set-6 [Elasticomyces elasticus]
MSSSVRDARPSSDYFEVKDTATSGRGVFALKDIKQGTPLLSTSTIAASAIYKNYQKEVCAQCFAYNRGVLWKVRDNARGVVFCSEICRDTWTTSMPAVCLRAREEVQKLLQRKQKLWDDEIHDLASPSAEAVEEAWTLAEEKAQLIRAARSPSASVTPTKTQLKAVRQAQAIRPEPDTIWFLLDAAIESIRQSDMITLTADLAADTQPYVNEEDLKFHIEAYLVLLAVVPTELLPHVQQSLMRIVQSRTTHNSFGLRSLDEGDEPGTAGSECFGFGVWPGASYWNHSCDPNVQKQRSGRTWKFWTRRDIASGEELCISYLGGDERDMSTPDRLEKLKRVWGFACGCSRCGLDPCNGESHTVPGYAHAAVSMSMHSTGKDQTVSTYDKPVSRRSGTVLVEELVRLKWIYLHDISLEIFTYRRHIWALYIQAAVGYDGVDLLLRLESIAVVHIFLI